MKEKKLIALLLAAAMCLSLCACGSSAQASAQTAESTEAPAAAAAASEPAMQAETDSAEVAADAEAPEEIGDITVTVVDESDDTDDIFTPIVAGIDSFESVSLPYYNKDTEHMGTMDVWYINGDRSVPYISLDSIIQILTDTTDFHVGYELTKTKVSEDWNVFDLTRENGSVLEIDFDRGLLTFQDMDRFTAPPEAANGLDVIDVSTNGADGNMLITHTNMFYKNANPVAISLEDYGIPMICDEDEGYLPLQTVADLLVSRYSTILACNGQAVLLAESLDTTPTEADAEDADTENTDTEAADAAAAEEESEPTLGDIYFSAPSSTKSEMLKIFNYNELCLALDYAYGLQSEHEIDSFNNLFNRTGLSDELLTDDALDTYTALSTLTAGYFGDMHSGVKHISYMAELDEAAAQDEYYGMDMQSVMYSQLTMAYSRAMYSTYRALYYPDGCPAYEEVDDTAYITFDTFAMNNLQNDKKYDYYANEPTANLDDTLELIMYANDQIKRENSPIRNVVVDLTNNGGGAADTAVSVVAWMLGSCSLSIEDSITGAQSTVSYTFDANRDGQFDENDYLGYTSGEYRLYCLISPRSFSCGNLVPAALSSSRFVTLIGDSSTGGACCVYPMTTADGTVFQISGPYRISTMNNGIYYSVDQGIDPDFFIDKLEHLYDRDYLTDYIHNLP